MKKLLAGSRLSMDRDADIRDGHQRSDSVLSENTKQTLADGRPASLDVCNFCDSLIKANNVPQDASLQDFDDLMRSDETMKVSLTPDRLKTMEVRAPITSAFHVIYLCPLDVQTRKRNTRYPAPITSLIW